jgi:hypothetical protein
LSNKKPQQIPPVSKKPPPKPTKLEDQNILENLADLLTQRQRKDSLPRPEAEIFSGDYLCFPNWQKFLETFIESRSEDPSERLYCLSRFTSRAAKEAVSGLFVLNIAATYNKAKEILISRFGNAFLIGDAYKKKINDRLSED